MKYTFIKNPRANNHLVIAYEVEGDDIYRLIFNGRDSFYDFEPFRFRRINTIEKYKKHVADAFGWVDIGEMNYYL